MKKVALTVTILVTTHCLFAQLEVAKLVGKNSKDYSIGFGAFLKFSHPVSEAGSVSLEGSFVYFIVKGSGASQGLALVPIKLGYRYTLNGSGTGFYIEPQAGYNVTGALTNDVVDRSIKGFVWSAGAGYLFEPSGKIQFDISLHYESVLYKGGSANFIALRLAHNFSF